MKIGARIIRALWTAYGGLWGELGQVSLRHLSLDGIGRGNTHDLVQLLRRHSADSVTGDFEDGADEDWNEVIGAVAEDCLVPLDEHRDGIEGRCHDSERVGRVVGPNAFAGHLHALGWVDVVL